MQTKEYKHNCANDLQDKSRLPSIKINECLTHNEPLNNRNQEYDPSYFDRPRDVELRTSHNLQNEHRRHEKENKSNRVQDGSESACNEIPECLSARLRRPLVI